MKTKPTSYAAEKEEEIAILGLLLLYPHHHLQVKVAKLGPGPGHLLQNHLEKLQRNFSPVHQNSSVVVYTVRRNNLN